MVVEPGNDLGLLFLATKAQNPDFRFRLGPQRSGPFSCGLCLVGAEAKGGAFPQRYRHSFAGSMGRRSPGPQLTRLCAGWNYGKSGGVRGIRTLDGDRDTSRALALSVTISEFANGADGI